MIDRQARNRMVEAIEAYLDDRITAFEFDERLDASSMDPLVGEVAHLCWFHYDDCTDHLVVLSKEQWDLFQRLILLLKSDVESLPPCERIKRRWGFDHALAWLGCIVFVALASVAGWGPQLLMLALPFGALSMLIQRHQDRQPKPPSRRIAARFPFSSWSQLRHVVSRTPGFSKRRYRQAIAGRRVRSEAREVFSRMIAHAGWLVCGPLILLAQGFPTVVHQLDDEEQ